MTKGRRESLGKYCQIRIKEVGDSRSTSRTIKGTYSLSLSLLLEYTETMCVGSKDLVFDLTDGLGNADTDLRLSSLSTLGNNALLGLVPETNLERTGVYKNNMGIGETLKMVRRRDDPSQFGGVSRCNNYIMPWQYGIHLTM